MSARVDGFPVSKLADAGLLTHPSSEAEVVERHGVPGSADPARVFTSRVLGGFEHEVIASRGLDIGHATWRGVPISWRSPVRDARALDRPAGTAWLARFTGGLLTTCGPFTIAEGEAEHGFHGEFSHVPSTRVAAHTSGGTTTVTGTMEAQDLFGPSLSIERSITSEAGDSFARIRVTDDIHNTGRTATTAALLYHVNIGPPVAVPGSVVTVDAESWRAAAILAEVPDPLVLPPSRNGRLRESSSTLACARVPTGGRVRPSRAPTHACWSRWRGGRTPCRTSTNGSIRHSGGGRSQSSPQVRRCSAQGVSRKGEGRP
jgi:hypothetical protein